MTPDTNDDRTDYQPPVTLPPGTRHDLRNAAQATGHTTVRGYCRAVLLDAIAEDLSKTRQEVVANDRD
jgi:hypothetical protein